ncbi:MAG: ATP-dependent DNA helicase [Myxococcales bacterium]|nr:ATP-dependent DNA helicase [Myxococcales bacterium]
MAAAVERALADDRVLLCEAGTGTGKTLAYLVPAVLSGKKVVVSTATRALQEQIATRDLPLIRKHLGIDPQAAVMKGLANYLCLRRFEEHRRKYREPAHEAAMARLEAWRNETSSGDISELDGLPEDDPLWREVTASSDTRVGPGCAHFDECFVTRMRRDAEAARLVVVNHHLFFADLALRGPHPGRVIPDYDAVIFDEAHQLEDIATDFFGVRVSSARIDAVLRDVETLLGVFATADAVLRGSSAVDGARRASDAFWSRLVRQLSSAGGPDGRLAIERDVWTGELETRWHELDSALEGVVALLESARGRVSQEKARLRQSPQSLTDALDIAGRRVTGLREQLAVAIDGAPGRVTWLETGSRSTVLSSSPVDVSGLFRDLVFDAVPAVVLTSATLATGVARADESPFAYLRSRLGLTNGSTEVTERLIDSPFDFGQNALFYTPRDLPEPNSPAFVRDAARRIAELVALTDGGAFVLTTSVRSMRALHAMLQGMVGRRLLLLQGEAPKSALLDRFRADGRAVLVATSSFWEGVDIPGHALRLVVLEKIPFLVPTDPIVKARSMRLEEQGDNPFMKLFVPAAALALKQGFGRLIRTRADFGVVALFDDRVHRKSYGRRVLAALPPARRTDELADVREFWSERAPG